MGDLNYRIVEGIELDAVYEHIENGAEGHETLPALDQLNVERQQVGSSRASRKDTSTFRPRTSRPGVMPRSTTGGLTKRCAAPRGTSWCRKTPQHHSNGSFIEGVTLQQYRRIEGLSISDHLPVNAVMDVSLRNVVQDRLSREHGNSSGARRPERSPVPVVLPMPKALWFSDVHYESDADVRMLLTASTTPLASIASALAEEGPGHGASEVKFRFAHSCIPTWLISSRARARYRLVVR